MKTFQKIIKYRWVVIAISVFITLAASLLLNKITIDPDLKHYFPESMESMVETEKIENIFGNQDIVMIIFKKDDIINEESLRRIKQVNQGILRTEGIRKTTSLFSSNHIYGKEGIMFVEPAVKRIPHDSIQCELLKGALQENDLVMNIVVADDFRSSAIIASLADGANEDSVFISINNILKEYPGNEKVHFGGLPYLRQSMMKDIRRDALILVPSALLIMVIFLFFVFREKRGVVLPFLVVIMSSIIALSVIPLFGWKFYFISLLVPIMLIAIANDYGIHIIAKYQELNANGSDLSMKKLAVTIAKKLWKPVLITGVTTISGIMSLLAHKIIPARQMAVVAGIGIVFALLYSIFLLPALLSLLHRSRPVLALQKKNHHKNVNFLSKLSFFIIRKYKYITPAAIIMTLMLGAGIIFLKVDSNEENFFPKKHPVKQASAIINSKYGGSENLSLLFQGDMLDPTVLRKIEKYEEKLMNEKEIDLVISFPDVVREISKSLFEQGDEEYDQIPGTRNAVAQYMELYGMNGNTEDLDQVVDFNYEHSHMLIRINNVSNKAINRIISSLKEMTAGDPNVAAIGGYGYVRSQLANMVVKGQFYSLLIALLVVFLILSVIFKSLKAGAISIIPLSMSIVILFGIMGYTGVRLDIATALLSSMMIGVGVDYTIHFLYRYREERQQNRPRKEAVITTLTTTGRGIIFNALSVIMGFLILIISSFTPIRFFGILVVVSISSCLIGALVLLPSMVLSYKFRFLEPDIKEGEKQHNHDLMKAM